MRQAIFIAVFVSLLVFAAAEEYPILDKQVEIRQAWIKVLTKTEEVRMQSAIDYLDGIEGTDTSRLSDLEDQFRGQVDDLEGMTTHIAINNAVKRLRQTSAEFRQEILRQAKQNRKIKGIELRRKTADDLKGNGEIEDLREMYWQVRKKNTLGIFDIHVKRAEAILDKLAAHDYDTSEAQAKLSEIEDLRDDYEAALDAEDKDAVADVHKQVISLTQELRQIVADLQVKVPARMRHRHWIGVAERVIARTGQIADELEALGIDVESLKAIADEAQSDLDTAKEAYENEDPEATVSALKEVRQDLADMREEYLNIIMDEDLDPGAEAGLQAVADAIEDSSSEMGSDLEPLAWKK